MGTSRRSGGQQPDTKREGRVSRAIAILRGRWRESGLTVGELADAAGVSESTLRTLLKRHTGLAPLTLLKSIRLEEARQLLIIGDSLLVKEVMYAVGYRDASHFTRDFERRFGCAPSEYRLGHAEAGENHH